MCRCCVRGCLPCVCCCLPAVPARPCGAPPRPLGSRGRRALPVLPCLAPGLLPPLLGRPRSRCVLSDLLADSTHVSQRELSTGVFEVRAAAVLAEQPCERHRARLRSAGGISAGAWLDVMPVSDRLRAAPRLFWLALCMRLGMPIADLLPVDGRVPTCLACGAEHDAFGRHPSVCRTGNRASMFTVRHDALQSALLWVYRTVGLAASAVQGASYLGTAGYTASGGQLRPDIAVWHYRAPSRHMFLDVAVTDPGGLAALHASPPSSAEPGVAAELRARKKEGKYAAACSARGCSFVPAIMERFGTVGCGLMGLLRECAGDRAVSCDAPDWSFTAKSRRDYFVQHVVFACVIADAAMLETAIDLDVTGSLLPPRAHGHAHVPGAVGGGPGVGRRGRAGPGAIAA